MPPRNDILKDFYIGWTTPKGEVIGKVKSSTLSDDGFTCTVELDNLKKEEKMNEKLKDADRIIIDRSLDGETVIAVAQKIVYKTGFYFPEFVEVGRASAKCGPNDIFDFNIGAKLAMDRLYEGYDMTPKPKRKPYNGLIYIHEYPGRSLNNRSIYRVKNGVISGCKCGGDAPYIFYDMSDTDLSRAIHRQIYGNPLSDITTIAYFVHNDITSFK